MYNKHCSWAELRWAHLSSAECCGVACGAVPWCVMIADVVMWRAVRCHGVP